MMLKNKDDKAIAQDGFGEQERIKNFDYNNLFGTPSSIKNDFFTIWNGIIEKIQLKISAEVAFEELKNLVLYEALDGSRSSLILNKNMNRGKEGAYYAINFIHVLRALGIKSCFIMIHTTYNRNRGEPEFRNILRDIEIGASFIKRYSIDNNIRCSFMCINENHELIHLLRDISECTKNGEFTTYFLFDYNEEWAMTEKGQNIIKKLPDIDVFVRHTKFQFSGGWIPGKMSRSVFLYSQNGTLWSNWDTDELITLVALALLAKILHKGEGLCKIYIKKEESDQRYELRELKLFNKVVNLREKPKKLFMIGSPIGIYQFYY